MYVQQAQGSPIVYFGRSNPEQKHHQNQHATCHCAGQERDIPYSPTDIATTAMDKHSSSPQHSATRSRNSAPESRTDNASASTWTPSKVTALLPTSLPLAKPHKGWDRVAKAPVAQNSRVKQVWRREFGLRSQPSTEEQVQGEELMNNTRHTSPTRVVKRKRIRSPVKESVGAVGTDDEPNHAPTRWENRRTSLRRECCVSDMKMALI